MSQCNGSVRPVPQRDWCARVSRALTSLVLVLFGASALSACGGAQSASTTSSTAAARWDNPHHTEPIRHVTPPGAGASSVTRVALLATATPPSPQRFGVGAGGGAGGGAGVGGPLTGSDSAPALQALPTLDPTAFPPGTPEAPPGAPPGSPGPISSVINYLIQATVYFPARTFQRAVERAARAIFTGQFEELAPPFRDLIGTVLRPDTPILGSEALAATLSGMSEVMTQAAMPLWALSLALLGLVTVTRSAAALGYGLGETAYELVRWFFICLLSGNALALVNLVHGAATLLAGGIAGVGMGDVAERLWRGLFPDAMLDPEFPLIPLMLGLVLAMILVAVLVISAIARYVLLVILGALAPLAIAAEGIPFTRFVCREWLAAFIKVELLQLMNAIVLVVFGRVADGMASAGGTLGTLAAFITMVGIVSLIATLNWKAFQYVYGAAQQVVETGARLVAGVAAFVASGGLSGGLTAASVAGLAGVLGNATGSPLALGGADGFRAGAQALAQAESADYAERGAAAGSGGGAAGSGVIEPARYRSPQVNLMAARDSARDNARDAQRQSRAADQQAASTGARTPDEKAAVRGAMDTLAATYGREATAEAVNAVAPTLSAMAHQSRGGASAGLSGVAAALGYASAGDLVGAFAEEHLTARQGRSAPPTGRRFGAPPAQTLLDHALGAPGAAAPVAASSLPPASAFGARGAAEVADVNSALAQLAGTHGEIPVRQAAERSAPALAALATQAGGLAPLARAAGGEGAGVTAGALVRDTLQAALAPQSPAQTDQRALAPTLQALAPDATSLNTLAQAAGYASSAALVQDLRMGAAAPSAPGGSLERAPSNAFSSELGSAAQALGYATPEALRSAVGEAAALASGAPAMTPTHLPAATAAALPLANAILQTPMATAAQQAQALGAESQRERSAVGGAIDALTGTYGAEATRSALQQIAPAVHAASAHIGLSPAAQALGYRDAGAWVSTWASGTATQAAAQAATPLATPAAASPPALQTDTAAPAFAGLVATHGAPAVADALAQAQPVLGQLAARFGPGDAGLAALAAQTGFATPTDMITAAVGQHLAPPLQTPPNAALDAQGGTAAALNALRAAYGAPTVDAALAAVTPALQGLQQALPQGDASPPALTQLAATLGLGDASRMTGALVEQHALTQQGAIPPAGGPLYAGLLTQQPVTLPQVAPQAASPAAAPIVTPNAAPNAAPNATLLAQTFSSDTPPGRAVPFDQVAGMSLAQRLNLPPNFGPVLSNLAWSLRAESTDPGLLWRVMGAADEAGAAHDDPQQAYSAFRQFVDDLYDAQAHDIPFHRPWRPDDFPLPGRREA